MSLLPTPLPDLAEPHEVSEGNGHGRGKTLLIAPVIVGSKPISARIGGGKRQCLGATAAPPDGAYADVLPDSQRSAEKFHEEGNTIVNVAVAPPAKFKNAKGVIQVLHRWRAREYKIRIHGLIRATGVEVRAGAACEDRANARSSEGVSRRHGNVGQ